MPPFTSCSYPDSSFSTLIRHSCSCIPSHFPLRFVFITLCCPPVPCSSTPLAPILCFSSSSSFSFYLLQFLYSSFCSSFYLLFLLLFFLSLIHHSCSCNLPPFPVSSPISYSLSSSCFLLIFYSCSNALLHIFLILLTCVSLLVFLLLVFTPVFLLLLLVIFLFLTHLLLLLLQTLALPTSPMTYFFILSVPRISSCPPPRPCHSPVPYSSSTPLAPIPCSSSSPSYYLLIFLYSSFYSSHLLLSSSTSSHSTLHRVPGVHGRSGGQESGVAGADV